MKAQQQPAEPAPKAPGSRGTFKTPPADVAGASPARTVPPAHDALCVDAQLLIHLRWQLAEARRENSELTVCLRRLLQQIQGLNALLDSYTESAPTQRNP